MDDDKTEQTPEHVKEQSAFARDEPPHVGADDDPRRPSDGDLTTEDLGEGGPAGG